MSETTTETSITLTSALAPSNPHMPDAREMTHWRVTLRYDGRSMSLPFSQGSGHGRRLPELNSVIDCLCSDASGAGQTFEEWARELGENPDSRKARATWRAVEKQTAAFKRLLGPATFQAMVYGRSLEDQAVEAAMAGPVSDATTRHTSTERHLRRIRGARYCVLEVELRTGGELSICGQAGRWVAGVELYESGGQIREELAAWFPEVAGWLSWHLNHLNAGCEHQTALGWGHGRDVALDRATMTAAQVETLAKRNEAQAARKRDAKRAEWLSGWAHARKQFHDFIARATGDPMITTDGFDDAERWRLLRAAGHEIKAGPRVLGGVPAATVAALDAELEKAMRELFPGKPVTSEVFTDSLMAPCPECGYAYGSAWLKRELPAEIRAEVEAFIATGALPGKEG